MKILYCLINFVLGDAGGVKSSAKLLFTECIFSKWVFELADYVPCYCDCALRRARARSHMCSPIIYPQPRENKLFIPPLSQAACCKSPSQTPPARRTRSSDRANTEGSQYRSNQVIIKPQRSAVTDDQWIITHAIDYEGRR